MRVLVFCAIFVLSLSSAHAFTQDEAKTVCKSLAIMGVGDVVPEFGGKHMLLIGYMSETADSFGCLYLDRRGKARNYYLFHSGTTGHFMQHLILQKTTEIMASGGSISRRTDKPLNAPTFNLARAKAACDVLEAERQGPPAIRSRLFAVLHQANINSMRKAHNFLPGEVRLLCRQFVHYVNEHGYPPELAPKPEPDDPEETNDHGNE